MPFNLILSICPVFLMAMSVNMILVMYVILCILSYDFNKLTMLYIHVHISITMTNKSGLTFFLSIKYLSVCLSYLLIRTYMIMCHFIKLDIIMTLCKHWGTIYTFVDRVYGIKVGMLVMLLTLVMLLHTAEGLTLLHKRELLCHYYVTVQLHHPHSPESVWQMCQWP